MPSVKFDVRGSDPDKATADFEQPKPGVYKAKIVSCEVKKPEGKARRIEAVLEIVGNKKYNGARLWEYINLESEAAVWKLDQFLQAFGLATKKKRTGSFDPAKLVGQTCKIRVRGGTNNEGDYRGEIASLLQLTDDEDEDDSEESDEDESEEEDDDDDEEEDDEDEDSDDDEEDDDEDEEEEEEEEPDDGYDDMSIKELRAAAKKAKLDTEGSRAELTERLRRGSDDADEDEVDYDEMSLDDLKKECRSRDLSANGSRSALIRRLKKNDEEPLDE